MRSKPRGALRINKPSFTMTVRRPNFEYRLARAHARPGDKSIASYLGKSNAVAIADFSSAYADQIEED